jgi:hypothetical protein
MRIIFAAALCVALGGCASYKYAMDEYTGVQVNEVHTADDTYRVFDKPAQNKLMITSSLGSAAGQGFRKGATFGIAQTEVPKPLFEAAALKYLEESGRSGCRIIDTSLIMQPQWEVKYNCSPVAPTVAALPPTQRRHRQRN